MRCSVIIPAAGSGTRFGGDTPKQFLELRGRALIVHAVERFLAESSVERIVVCGSPEGVARLEALSAGWDRVNIVEGGATRRDSVAAGLRSVGSAADLVAVHDAVRPYFSSRTFQAVLEAASESGAALPAMPVTETIHRAEAGFIAETPDRTHWYGAQTPQCFRAGLLKDVLDRAIADGYAATDEAGAAARYGHRVRIVPGDAMNIKITRALDLLIAEATFDRWDEEE